MKLPLRREFFHRSFHIMKKRFLNLNDCWFIAKDENDIGKAEGWEHAIPDFATPAYVPSIISEFFPNYHGVCYYWCRFSSDIDPYDNGKTLLRFGGIDYKADVWLNGKYIGSDESGETPFHFDVTDTLLAKGENLLAVRVLNPCDREIDGLTLMNTPHRNKVMYRSAGSCLNHGGIWYGVDIEALPAAYINDLYVAPNAKNGEINVSLTLGGDTFDQGKIEFKIYTSDSVLVAQNAFSLSKDAASSVTDFSLKVENFKLWDVDDPFLYRLEATFYVGTAEHTVIKRIGFREFHVENGFFYLNGRRIFLRSSHSGNAFPVGLMRPKHSELLRQDFIYAKAAGFNMLRCIAGLFRPEQLEIADEIGLLIYDECFASWCLGYSHSNAWAEGEFSKVQEAHPDIYLGDEKDMLARWRHATDRMILRDRNHPSVVIWGLLNETLDNGVFREAVKYLPRARELDPTRVVVLNSGRFDCNLSVGSASNPYSLTWENTWGNDGKPEILEGVTDKYALMGDNHHYALVPLSKKEIDIYRSLGVNTPAAFLSEMGIGPLFDVIDELRGYQMRGERLDLEDSAWLSYQSEAFERDFHELELEKIFAFPERLLRESQRLASRDRKIFFDVLRSCDRIAGYSLTGLLDHGMCGEGLFTFWRRWKPGTFDAVSEGWAKVKLCLFIDAVAYRDVPLKIEAYLANDGLLKSGTYHARFAIIGERGTEHFFELDFALNGEKLAEKILDKTLDIHLLPGQYKLVAEITNASCAACETEFKIMERPCLSGVSVHAIGLSKEETDFFTSVGIKVHEWNGEEASALLVGSADEETIASALSAAERGAKVAFLDPASTVTENAVSELQKVFPDIRAKKFINWLYHKECVMLDEQIFSGVGHGLAPLSEFVGSFPEYTFILDKKPTKPICPAFMTGYYHVKDGYLLSYAMLGENFGKGHVLLSTFTLLSNLGHPMSDTMLTNIVEYLKKSDE